MSALPPHFRKDLDRGLFQSEATELKFAVKLEFPLWMRAARGRVSSALATRERVEFQRQFLQERLSVAGNDASQAIEAAQKRIGELSREVALSQQVEEGERLRFFHGDSNIFTVNLREQATVDAVSRKIDAFVDFHRAKAEITALETRMGSPPLVQ